ncbi:MAG: hypothetical protein ACTJLL_00510, partial [Anaplasma sp.]
VQILKRDAVYHDVGALIDASGEKKPCHTCAVALENFPHTTVYKFLGSIDPSLRHMETLSLEMQKKQDSPYGILITDLNAVYCVVRDYGYLTQTLLNSWRSLQKVPQNEPCLPAIQDSVNLLEKTAQKGEVLLERNSRGFHASCGNEYPFTDEVLAQMGDAALTSFLTAISISPMQKSLMLCSDDCKSTYLNALV